MTGQMMLHTYITWDIDPELFSWGPISVRYYGLSYALAFLCGFYLVEKMFKNDNVPAEWGNKAFLYVLIGIVVGGRLGHVFFYEWSYYSWHPWEILMFWRGGMASHGAALGIVVAVILYSKRVARQPILWTLDYAAVTVALGGFFIRLGNLMNSEIIGRATDVPWAFRFIRARGIADPWTPRHPAQLYEALAYLVIFFILMYMYWCTNARKRQGLIFGTILIGVFGARFVIEFFKENQKAFENEMLLNMGQLLSIPFVVMGVFYIVRGLRRAPSSPSTYPS